MKNHSKELEEILMNAARRLAAKELEPELEMKKIDTLIQIYSILKVVGTPI